MVSEDALLLAIRVQDVIVLDYIHHAWKEVLSKEGLYQRAIKFERVFRNKFYRPAAAERLRSDLLHDFYLVRLRAARLLADLGDLTDVGLFFDLIKLPAEQFELKSERDFYIEVLRVLAGQADKSGLPS